MASDTTYTIKKGDTLSKIAKKFGLSSWKEIWYYTKNKAFRDSHSSPNMIYPGEIVIIPGGNSGPPDAPSGNTTIINVKIIEITSLSFNNDHEGLKLNDADWTFSGTDIKEPKWDINHCDPVVISMKEKINLTAEFSVNGPKSLSLNGDVLGNGIARCFTFTGSGTIKPSQTKITLVAKDVYPYIIVKEKNIAIKWKVKFLIGAINAGTTGPHVFYCVYGKPINKGNPEDGMTTKRMHTAVGWVNNCSSYKPLKVVEELFDKFPDYVLGFEYLPKNQQDELNKNPLKKAALIDAGFATYKKDYMGGAWPLAEYQTYGGECQAIVRLIRGILHQIGCPGTIEIKYVNVEVTGSYTVKTLIKDYGTKCVGPKTSRKYVLVDDEVKVGNSYKNEEIGWNNYEAFMKYTYNNSSGNTMAAWFGGGVGKFGEVDIAKKKEVEKFEDSLIKVFWGVAEYEWITVSGEDKRKITWVHIF